MTSGLGSARKLARRWRSFRPDRHGSRPRRSCGQTIALRPPAAVSGTLTFGLHLPDLILMPVNRKMYTRLDLRLESVMEGVLVSGTVTAAVVVFVIPS